MVHLKLKIISHFLAFVFCFGLFGGWKPDRAIRAFGNGLRPPRCHSIERIVLSTTTKPILRLGCSALGSSRCLCYLVQNSGEFQFSIKTSVRNCDLGMCESCEYCDRQEREMGENWICSLNLTFYSDQKKIVTDHADESADLTISTLR